VIIMNILYFARIREHIGKSSEEVILPDQVTTVADVIEYLESLGNNYQNAFAEPDLLRAAVNDEYVPLDYNVSNADELALFPPMTGG
jgi:molybdopterin synthase sulfur carrier subunit